MTRRPLTLAVVLAVLAVVAVVALLRLADRSLAASRAELERQLSTAVGRSVHIGHVGLGWRGGLGIDLENVVVDDAPEFGTDPLLRAGNVGLTIALRPLLTDREVAFDVLVREPAIRLVRSPKGVWNYSGLGPVGTGPAPPVVTPGAGATPAAAPVAPPAGNAPFTVVLRQARIAGGTADIFDAAARPPRTRHVTQIDLTVNDVGTLAPTRFAFAAAVDAADPNVVLDGTAGPFFDRTRIPIAAAGWVGPFGTAAATVEKLRIAAAVLPDAIEIASFDATTLGGTVHASGRVPTDPTASIALATSFTTLDLARLMPLADPSFAGRVTGTVDGTADLRFRADSLAQLRQTLTGPAELHVRNAELHEFNMATVVVDGVSGVPGLGNLVSAATRSKYAHLFATTRTRIPRAETALHLANEAVDVQGFLVSAEDFSLQATGTVGFDLIAALAGVLSLSAPVSADIAADVRVAGLLRNESGEMSLPWTLRGKLGQAVPQVETAAIARLVGRGLERDVGSDVVAPVVRQLDRAGPVGQALKGLFGR